MSKEVEKGLEKLTRTKLIEEAKNYSDITGAHGMSKEELIAAIYAEKAKLGEEVPEPAAKKPAAAKKSSKKKGPDRAVLKGSLREIKAKKAEALQGGDHLLLKRLRREYKKINRVLRRTPTGSTG